MFSYLMLQVFGPSGFGSGGEDKWILDLVSPVIGVVVGLYVWRTSASISHGPVSFAGVGAVVLGGLGCLVDFLGPMLLVPDGNQGPLLGIFITGPAGAVIGAAGGWFFGRARRLQAGKIPPHRTGKKAGVLPMLECDGDVKYRDPFRWGTCLQSWK